MTTILLWWWIILGTLKEMLRPIKSMIKGGQTKMLNLRKRNLDNPPCQSREVVKLVEIILSWTPMTYIKCLQMPQELMFQKWCIQIHPWKKKKSLSKTKNSKKMPSKTCLQEIHSKEVTSHSQLKDPSNKLHHLWSFKILSQLLNSKACKSRDSETSLSKEEEEVWLAWEDNSRLWMITTLALLISMSLKRVLRTSKLMSMIKILIAYSRLSILMAMAILTSMNLSELLLVQWTNSELNLSLRPSKRLITMVMVSLQLLISRANMMPANTQMSKVERKQKMKS